MHLAGDGEVARGNYGSFGAGFYWHTVGCLIRIANQEIVQRWTSGGRPVGVPAATQRMFTLALQAGKPMTRASAARH
jgi:hypothetical protein